MLNYKKCSIEDFDAAMKEKDEDVKTISNTYFIQSLKQMSLLIFV